MPFEQLTASPAFTWVVIPILIFFARIIDVSVGTIRMIFVARGNKVMAPFLGFFEVLVWLAAIQQIFVHLTNPLTYIMYGLGFATGTYVGMTIEEKLSIGKAMIRTVTMTDASALVAELRQKYKVTTIDGQGREGKVKVILAVLDRKHIVQVIGIIKKHDPKAFYTIEDVRYVREEDIPRRPHTPRKLPIAGFMRKGK